MENGTGTVEVVAALIEREGKILICQRPREKARGLLWEFVGGKVEAGETGRQALKREVREELGMEIEAGDVYMDVFHRYPDLAVHLTLYRCTAEGEPQKLEHRDLRWVAPSELGAYSFCPADKGILEKIMKDAGIPAATPRFRTALFDLDGTLLPMDQDVFTKAYFRLLAAKLAPRGYEAKALVDGIWAGTAAMVRNDGSRTNEEAFWDKFASLFGERVYGDFPVFEEFYRTDFNRAKDVCGFQPAAADTVSRLRACGTQLILASNPLFPRIAQENRMRWAGVDPTAFTEITSYENSRYCKPNPLYYTEISERWGLDPGQCLMIGNDAKEDAAAADAGMQVFLLTDCLINSGHRDLAGFPHGGYPELNAFLFGL